MFLKKRKEALLKFWKITWNIEKLFVVFYEKTFDRWLS